MLFGAHFQWPENINLFLYDHSVKVCASLSNSELVALKKQRLILILINKTWQFEVLILLVGIVSEANPFTIYLSYNRGDISFLGLY